MLRLINRIGKPYLYASVVITATAVLLLIIVFIVFSWDAVSQLGFKLFQTKWNPESGDFGIIPMLFGSLAVASLALCLAIPFGVFTAIFISEYLGGNLRFYVKSTLELLAGIPSIVYGLIGVAFLSIWVQDWFNLGTGRTIFAAGILLAVMILPTIITLVDDAIQFVPSRYKEAALGLGLYRHEVFFKAILPIAKLDILNAILLGLGRALGETMAVMLVIGSIDRLPSPIYNWLQPAQTITSKLGRELAETAFGSLHFSVLIAMGLLLFIVVMTVTFLAQSVGKNSERIYE